MLYKTHQRQALGSQVDDAGFLDDPDELFRGFVQLLLQLLTNFQQALLGIAFLLQFLTELQDRLRAGSKDSSSIF